MPTSSASDLYPSPCVPPQQESAARAQFRRDGSPGLPTPEEQACENHRLGRRFWASIRDREGRDPQVRVALATGVCGSQHENAAFEIVVVRSMILCVRSLIELCWLGKTCPYNSITLTDGLKSQITLYSHIRTVCGPGSASALPGSHFSHSRTYHAGRHLVES